MSSLAERKFWLGVNLPWFAGRYGHDLARNDLRGWPAWGSQSAEDMAARRAIVESAFAQLERDFGAQVVRIWLFEGGEALLIDGKALAIAPELVREVEWLHRCARAHHMSIYWCLLASHAQHTPQFFALEAALMGDINDERQLLRGVLAPLVSTLSKQDNLFGIDVINEPEQHIALASTDWPTLQAFIARTTSFVHDASQGRIRVSVGTAGEAWLKRAHAETLRRYVGLGLDFFDIHVYARRSTTLLHYETLRAHSGIDKPCLIGEFGQRSRWRSDRVQAAVAERILSEATSKGYAGALAWYYHRPAFGPPRHIGRAERHALIYHDGKPRPVHRAMQKFSVFDTAYF